MRIHDPEPAVHIQHQPAVVVEQKEALVLSPNVVEEQPAAGEENVHEEVIMSRIYCLLFAPLCSFLGLSFLILFNVCLIEYIAQPCPRMSILDIANV